MFHNDVQAKQTPAEDGAASNFFTFGTYTASSEENTGNTSARELKR